MSNTQIPEQEFRLGLTMAGAISAGCYTGGVMDYLFEILEIWQLAKDGESDQFQEFKEIIPRHRVIIDVMGGASAGGMTTTMAAIYALNGNINPVKAPGKANETKNNIFYDNWVLMDDLRGSDPKPTFEKLWNCDDLDDNIFKSFLNSKFVDRIAEAVFNNNEKDILSQTKKLPKYVSPDLQMILSHTLLRGVPMEVNFQTPIARSGRTSVLPNHTTYEHYMVSHFRLNGGIAPKSDEYLFLNPYSSAHAATMKLATMATGAFPLGLMYRAFGQDNMSDAYLKTIFKRIISGKFGEADPDPKRSITLKYFPKNFSSVTIDGGAINNEPYREVMSLMSDRYGIPDGTTYPSYGVVMIDPFPDQAKSKKEYEAPADLLGIIPEIISTLTDQSRVKRREMLETEPQRYFRSIVFPRKWNKVGENIKPDANPIACASVGAFGGFFDINFRQHDYFLGRDNARNFFRYFFSMPYDPDNNIIHPIHAKWKPEMVEKFKIEKGDQIFLPIIPDLYMLLEDEQERNDKRYRYTIPDKPCYRPEPLFEAREAIEKRLLRIMDVLKSRDYETKKEKDGDFTKVLMDQHYHKAFLKRLAGWLSHKALLLVYWLGKKAVAKSLTEKIIKTVLADLEKNGLLIEKSLK